MNIVVANGPGRLDNGQEVILFPSRWDSGIPNGGKAPFKFYPYELAYLSALLKRELPDAKVTMLDGNLWGWDGDRYIQEIGKLQPDWLICELSALTYPTMTRVAHTIKDRAYGYVNTCLCGPMASQDSALPDWDWCMTGEYELKVLELLGEEIPYVANKGTGLINLDWLPWPEDEDIPRGAYREINHYIDYRTNAVVPQVYLSRGCPLSCSFCTVPTYYGGHGKSHKSHRVRDVEDCCEEILYLKAKYGDRMKGIYTNEEAHNANIPWLMELCEAFIKRGIKDKHNLFIDAMCGYWTMTEEVVKAMGAAGYNHIRFGVESTSETVGKTIGKTIHLERMEKFMRWCKAEGIHCYGTFQIGAPGSTKETDLKTLEDLRRWRREGLMEKHQVSTSTPQVGTPFYQQVKENGWLVTEDVNQFDGMNAVVSYPTYAAKDIFAVRMTAP